MNCYEAQEAAVTYISYELIQGWVEKKAIRDAPAFLEVYLHDDLIGRAEGIPVVRPDGSPGNRIIFDFHPPVNVIKPQGSYPFLSIRLAESGRPLFGSPADNPRLNVNAEELLDIFTQANVSEVPPLDAPDLNESALNPDQLAWRRQGFLLCEGLLPAALIEAYVEERQRRDPGPPGWSCPVPYMHLDSIRDLALHPPLANILDRLFGVPMGLNLNLTGWVSTQRDWHQDNYLNPPHVKGWYAAVWMALDDIDPQSGPFEFIPGSHRWPMLSRERIIERLPYHERIRIDWPSSAERIVVPACERMIAEKKATPERFLAKRGDVLIWHPLLFHRGSKPEDMKRERRSLICHFSAIDRRPDFPPAVQHEGGGWYFPIDLPL